MLEADPFAVGVEPAAVGDLQRRPPAPLVMPAVGYAAHLQPLRRFWRQDRQRGGGRRNLHLTGREYIAAVRAFGGRERDDALALRADLCGCLAPATLTGTFRTHEIDRPMAADIARKIQNEAVLLARRQPRATTDHLHIEPGRFASDAGAR